MYTVISGTFDDVYFLADQLDSLLLSTGWLRTRTLANGVSLRDRVYKTSSDYADIYTRVVASGTILAHALYGYYPDVGDEYQYELWDSSYVNMGTTVSGNYWVFGDSNFFWAVVNDTVSGTFFATHTGYLDSYMSANQDRYPVSLVLHQLDSDTLNSNRIIMYTAASGTASCSAVDTSFLFTSGDPFITSSGTYRFTSVPVVVRDEVGYRGQLRGVMQMNKASGQSSGGTFDDLQDGGRYLYVSHSNLDNNTFVYGPLNV